jgi:hypothetical protein
MRSGLTVRPLAVVLALALTGLLAGCSAGESGGSSGSSAAGLSADSGSSEAIARGSAAAPKSAANSFNSAELVQTKRVQKADLTLQVARVPAAASSVRAVAAGLGGVVSAETSGFGPVTDAKSVLTLRVPEPRFNDALTRLAGVGREVNLSTSSDDVTSAVADVSSRVASQQASVARVRALLSRATSLKDVVLIESELSNREADLESEQAQLRVLADQADLSTITVTLATAPVGAATKPEHRAGFLTGLKHGWHAAAVTTRVVLTAIGAALPFAAVLLPLTAAAYFLRRRLTSSTHSAPPNANAS